MTPESRIRLRQRAAAGDPNARFVEHVLTARENGAPQYGARFTAWLIANGDPDPAATIRKLEG